MDSPETLFARVRAQFPMLAQKEHGAPFIYLDSAATAQKPTCVIDAIARFYREEYATVHRGSYFFAERASEAFSDSRRKIATFLDSPPDSEIIFTRGATNSINLVARCFSEAFLHPKDEILISAMEHHSNLVPWQQAAARHGALLRVIPLLPSGELDMQSFRNLLNEKTKIVALCHVSNVLGTVNPIEEITKAAHKAGARVLIDGAQSVAHMPISLRTIDPDFFVFSGHKMMGPTGIGILYGKTDLLNAMPPYESGGGMIDVVTEQSTTYLPPPLKFEAGTPPIAEAIGLGAAIDFLSAIGMKTIETWESELLHYALRRMSEVPRLHVLGTPAYRGALFCFTVDDIHPLDIALLLDAEGIAIRSGHLCAQPLTSHLSGVGALGRVSLAFYNTKQDLDIFAEALLRIVKKLRDE
jgi:cysteine desulfurase/selenocysteine lyase